MMHLLKKELSELFNKQMIISLIVSVAVIVVLGIVMSTAVTAEIENSGTVHLIDMDQTEFTEQIKTHLTEQGYTVEEESFAGSYEDTMAACPDWKEAAFLPEGMTASLLEKHEAAQVGSITKLQTTSVVALSLSGSTSVDAVTAAVSAVLSAQFLGDEQGYLTEPVSVVPYTVANGASAQISTSMLVSSLAMFDQLMPLILFMLVVLTSQTIITAVAAEKTDKTLETLLASPVPRSSVIGAKMLAALIVAVVYAAVFTIGFSSSMMFSISGSLENVDVGGAFEGIVTAAQAAETLGLQISPAGWCGVIAQLILTIGIALTASMILGGLVEDAKGSQTASLPIMLCTMFPYIFSMISDIRQTESPFRELLYCIPFTHTFIATSCLRFHQTGIFWFGLLYQAVFLAVVIAAALKLFRSDILFVHTRKKKSAHAEKKA